MRRPDSRRPVTISIALVLAGLAFPPAARATRLTVPDQVPTIQAAIDAVVDTIVVRPGVYPEAPVVRQPFSLMTASDDPGGPPQLGGLDFTGAGMQLHEFRGLAFSSGILIAGPYRVEFTDCVIPGISAEVVSSRFLRCRIDGSLSSDASESATVDSCHIVGGAASGGSRFVVRGCLVEGPGFGVSAHAETVLVDGNTIRGTLSGVALDNSRSTVVSNNLIENCVRYGIYDSGHDLKLIANNVVRDCAEGMQFENGRLFVIGNRLSGSDYSGMYIMTNDPLIEGNVVTGSRYYGIRVSAASTGIKIRNNTLAFNGYAGIDVDDSSAQDECVGNIGYRNGTSGVSWEVAPGATFACNNWFENGFGAAAGRELFATEFSVDPRFCDPDSGDFHLRSDSPLADWPGCGRVGALGVGCAATATTVQRFEAERVPDGVRLVWQIGPGATAAEVWLERSGGDEGEAWVRPVTERSLALGAVVEVDRGAAADRAYRYRLMAREGADAVVIGAEIQVQAVANAADELIWAGPSPGSGPVRIAFSLARTGPIRVDVFDVLGRSVATPARGAWPAGVHHVEWSGLVHGENARPGLYLIRYTHPGGQDTRRLVRTP